MKKNLLIGTMALLAGSLLAADSSPKDDIVAAAKKLADGGNYSWKSTLDLGPNSQFTPGPTEGKTDKDGLTWLSTTFQDNTMEGLMKGTNHVVVKTEEGWQTAAELGGGGGGGGGFGNPGMLIARRLQNLKAPAVEIEELAGKAKELKKDGGVYSGDLTEAGAQSLLTFGFGGRRGGGGQAPPPPKDAKGSVKFWVKDGAVTKYESKVTGKMEFQGEERDIERTTTVEIKDIGTTKINAPDEAKKKLS